MSNIVVGANSERSRSHNRQVVLGRVRAAGEIGRAEIARASGLSTQAVSNIIADLLEDGFIVERGRRVGGAACPRCNMR
jgi:predicted transcriptional regulator